MSQKTTSLLSQNIRLKGKLSLAGGVWIDGELKGDLISEGTVNVGQQAEIMGNINALAVVSSGRIQGNIYAEQEVVLNAPGSLIGNVETRKFYVDDGVRFEGVCTILQ